MHVVIARRMLSKSSAANRGRHHRSVKTGCKISAAVETSIRCRACAMWLSRQLTSVTRDRAMTSLTGERGQLPTVAWIQQRTANSALNRLQKLPLILSGRNCVRRCVIFMRPSPASFCHGTTAQKIFFVDIAGVVIFWAAV